MLIKIQFILVIVYFAFSFIYLLDLRRLSSVKTSPYLSFPAFVFA